MVFKVSAGLMVMVMVRIGSRGRMSAIVVFGGQVCGGQMPEASRGWTTPGQLRPCARHCGHNIAVVVVDVVAVVVVFGRCPVTSPLVSRSAAR